MYFDDILKPRLVDVQFDTSKLKAINLADETFDSELEDSDGDSGGASMMDTQGTTSDSLFVIDNKGQQLDNQNMQIDIVSKDDQLVKTRLSDLRPSLYISSDAASLKAKMRSLNAQWAEDVLLKKSVLKDDAEKERTVATRQGKKAERRQRQADREKTAGQAWFDMAKPELTDERKRDLELLRMRKVMDTKTFYKKNDIGQALPKYFEVGTVVDGATDFYSGRLTHKQRKQTLVDELLADDHFGKNNKKKYREALERQQYSSKKAYVQLKRLKKKGEAKQKKKAAKTAN